MTTESLLLGPEMAFAADYHQNCSNVCLFVILYRNHHNRHNVDHRIQLLLVDLNSKTLQ